MISFQQAYDSISEILGDTKISRIRDAGSFWLFEYVLYTPGTEVIIPGCRPYAVNKSDGKIWALPTPPELSKKQINALNNAKEIPVPLQ